MRGLDDEQVESEEVPVLAGRRSGGVAIVPVNPDGSWWQSTQNFPHHTAIVADVSGSTLTLLHQNLDGQTYVQQTGLNLDDMVQGTMWAYRPVSA